LRQVFVLKTGDVKLPAQQRLEQIQIIAGEQVKAAQRTLAFTNRGAIFQSLSAQLGSSNVR
jgi:hypothetical protein